MKKIILCLFLLIGIIQPSCDDENPVIDGHKWYLIEGLIIDSATSLPIDSAKISLRDTVSNYYVYSDSSGNYRLIADTYNTLFVQKPGYNTQTKTVTLNQNVENINFKLIKK